MAIQKKLSYRCNCPIPYSDILKHSGEPDKLENSKCYKCAKAEVERDYDHRIQEARDDERSKRRLLEKIKDLSGGGWNVVKQQKNKDEIARLTRELRKYGPDFETAKTDCASKRARDLEVLKQWYSKEQCEEGCGCRP